MLCYRVRHRCLISIKALNTYGASRHPLLNLRAKPGMCPQQIARRPQSPLCASIAPTSGLPVPPDSPATSTGMVPSIDLDWKPTPSLSQDLLCMAAAAAACVALYVASPPPSLSLMYALGIGALFACLLLVLRAVLAERMYSERLMPEQSLGDKISRFVALQGVTVHYRGSSPTPAQGLHGWEGPGSRDSASGRGDTEGAGSPAPSPVPSQQQELAPFAIHCFHGFGANSFSFDEVLSPLSSRIPQGSLVTAHDLPGFGLTSRPVSMDAYQLSFNGRLGALVQDHALGLDAAAVATAEGPSDAAAPTSCGRDLDGQQDGGRASSVLSGASSALAVALPPRVRRVLMGHSLGGISATMQALERNDVEALVLVAPAILAWGGGGGKGAAGGVLEEAPFLGGSRLGQQGAGMSKRFRVVAAVPTAAVAKGAGGSEAAAGSKTDSTARPEPPASSSRPSSPGAASPLLQNRSPAVLVQLLQRVTATLRAAVMLSLLLALRLLRPLTVVLLRSLVRSRDFWVRGLQSAFYDKKCVTDRVVDMYRIPQLVRGWEMGMCRFLESRLAHVSCSDLWQPWMSSPGAEAPVDATLTAQLVAAIRSRHQVSADPAADRRSSGSVPPSPTGLFPADRDASAFGSPSPAASRALPLRVLVVHGRQDALVPCSNSERLARAMPPGCGCELLVMEGCGHMPHEERPEEFAEVVAQFLAGGAV